MQAPAEPSSAGQLACPRCGSIVPEGRRFCTTCGFSLTGEPVPALAIEADPGLRVLPTRGSVTPQLRQTMADKAGSALKPLEIGVLGGFALAAAGTFLDWATTPLASANAWSQSTFFQIADWLKMTSPIDGIIVVALAVAGILSILGPRFVRSLPVIPFAPAVVGVAAAVVGVLNYLFVDGRVIGVEPGIGLYLVIAGGIVAAVCTVLAHQKKAAA